MARQFTREEIRQMAKEKVQRQKEEEKRQEEEFYQKITTGYRWNLFKAAVVFCTAMAIITTIEIFVDGESRKLGEDEWRIDRELYIMWHQSVKVDDYLFVPHLRDWSNHVENSIEITYTPIFRTAKKLTYDMPLLNGTGVRQHEEVRRRSIFTWFPYLQILMLIPLATFIFKRKKPWFNFARIASFVIVVPGIILVTVLTLL